MAKTTRSNHPNSREITIFRFQTHAHAAQKDAQDYMALSHQPIGPYFKSQGSPIIGTGLTRDEENLLLPRMIKADPEDKDFLKRVEDFYNRMTTKVPFATGRTLEIGMEGTNLKGCVWFEETDQKDSKGDVVVKKHTQFPINLSDYLHYRHALEHPEVSPSMSVGKGDSSKRYYIHDSAAELKEKEAVANVADRAMSIYLQLKEAKQDAKMRNIMALLLMDTRGMKNAAVEQELRSYVLKNPSKFIEVYEVQDFEIRYWIRQMIQAGALREMGHRVLRQGTTDPIGHNMDEAVVWMKDPKNSSIVAELKAATQDVFTHLGKQDKPPVTPPKEKTPTVAETDTAKNS